MWLSYGGDSWAAWRVFACRPVSSWSRPVLSVEGDLMSSDDQVDGVVTLELPVFAPGLFRPVLHNVVAGARSWRVCWEGRWVEGVYAVCGCPVVRAPSGVMVDMARYQPCACCAAGRAFRARDPRRPAWSAA